MSSSAADKVEGGDCRAGELRNMRRRHSFAIAASAARSASSTSRGNPIERLDRLIREQQQRTYVSTHGNIANAAARPSSSKATSSIDLTQGNDDEDRLPVAQDQEKLFLEKQWEDYNRRRGLSALTSASHARVVGEADLNGRTITVKISLGDGSRARITPEMQKKMIGERLFPLVYQSQPELAGKITGMILETNHSEIMHLLESPHALDAKIKEALHVLETRVIENRSLCLRNLWQVVSQDKTLQHRCSTIIKQFQVRRNAAGDVTNLKGALREAVGEQYWYRALARSLHQAAGSGAESARSRARESQLTESARSKKKRKTRSNDKSGGVQDYQAMSRRFFNYIYQLEEQVLAKDREAKREKKRARSARRFVAGKHMRLQAALSDNARLADHNTKLEDQIHKLQTKGEDEECDAINSAMKAVVIVRVDRLQRIPNTEEWVTVDKFASLGSGFLYSEDDNHDHCYVVTNYHVISCQGDFDKSNDRLRVLVQFENDCHEGEDWDDTWHEAGVLGWCKNKSDIAMLKISLIRNYIQPCRHNKLKRAMKVHVLGSPVLEGGTTYPHLAFTSIHATIGNIDRKIDFAGERGIIGNLSCFQFNAYGFYQGYSGGPVINSNGNLVGVSVANAEEPPGIHYALSIDSLSRSLRRIMHHQRKQGMKDLLRHPIDVGAEYPNDMVPCPQFHFPEWAHFL